MLILVFLTHSGRHSCCRGAPSQLCSAGTSTIALMAKATQKPGSSIKPVALSWFSSEVNVLVQASKNTTYDILTSAWDSSDQEQWEKRLWGCYSRTHRGTGACGSLGRFLQCLHLKFAVTQERVEVTLLSSNRLRTKIKVYYWTLHVTLYVTTVACGFPTQKSQRGTATTEEDQHTKFLLVAAFSHRSQAPLTGRLKHRGRVVCCCLPLSLRNFHISFFTFVFVTVWNNLLLICSQSSGLWFQWLWKFRISLKRGFFIPQNCFLLDPLNKVSN